MFAIYINPLTFILAEDLHAVCWYYDNDVYIKWVYVYSWDRVLCINVKPVPIEHKHEQIYRTHTHTYIYIYTYIYTQVYIMYVCMGALSDKLWDSKCLALIAQMVRVFGMNPKVGVRDALRSRHILSQQLWHFHKNIRLCVENKCCCWRTVNISNVNITSNIHSYIYI